MNASDVIEITKGIAPVVKAYVAGQTAPLIERIAVLEKTLTALEEAATRPERRT